MSKKKIENESKLQVIPLGGLEQIGMNITAFRYEDSIIVWTAVCLFLTMTCWESTL